MNSANCGKEKHRELPWWFYGRGKSEIVVTPESSDAFVVITRRMTGARAKSVYSRRLWINANAFVVVILAIIMVFTAWLFVLVDAPLVAFPLVLLFFFLFVPQLWLFIWSFLPPKTHDSNSDIWDESEAPGRSP
jgi:hypothetical protein